MPTFAHSFVLGVLELLGAVCVDNPEWPPSASEYKNRLHEPPSIRAELGHQLLRR